MNEMTAEKEQGIQAGPAAERYDCLRLENQLCFPLYVCSKEIIRRYKPLLDELDLTYTQYITMMALWEHREMNVRKLGEYLFLDSGTLTPVLKKLEAKHYLTRERSSRDERNLIVSITKEGEALREAALKIPERMACCVNLTQNESLQLYQLLHKMLENI